MASSDEKLEQRFDKLNLELIYLGQSFERYFCGKDPVPPVVKLKNYKTKIKVLTQEKFRDNALKFKVNNLFQKLLAYEANWKKKLHLIELGLTSTGKKIKTKDEKPYLRKAQEDQLYKDFLASQKKVSGKAIDKDQFLSHIKAQKKKLEEQNNIDDVWFKITIKDGKTTIKAYRKNAE
ncbi:hypothetical protein MRY82_02200 [bacterium]|nr:hypothetical protein [bacterium]